MATHHLVILVNDLNKAIESKIAEVIAENKIFLVGINVNLVEIIDRKNIKMKTFERGAGWTLACGTGASAAYSVLRKRIYVIMRFKCAFRVRNTKNYFY